MLPGRTPDFFLHLLTFYIMYDLDTQQPDTHLDTHQPELVYTPSSAQGINQIPYTWQFKGKKPGITATLMFLLHGNEKKPLYILNKLLQMADEEMAAGVLNLIIGNPLAWQQGTRFVQEDGNRAWGNGPITSPDKARVEDIKPIIDASDVMIDFHSTLKKSDPFLVVPELNHGLAGVIPQLGIKTIITGEGLKHPSGEPVESDLYAASKGALGITFETGEENNENDEEIEKITQSVIDALVYLGIFKAKPRKIKTPKAETFNISKAYKQIFAGNNFKFTKEWKNFEPVAAGTIIGYEADMPITVEKDSRILFPKSPANIVPGNQVCILIDFEFLTPTL